jgi:hypothetical protein
VFLSNTSKTLSFSNETFNHEVKALFSVGNKFSITEDGFIDIFCYDNGDVGIAKPILSVYGIADWEKDHISLYVDSPAFESDGRVSLVTQSFFSSTLGADTLCVSNITKKWDSDTISFLSPVSFTKEIYAGNIYTEDIIYAKDIDGRYLYFNGLYLVDDNTHNIKSELMCNTIHNGTFNEENYDYTSGVLNTGKINIYPPVENRVINIGKLEDESMDVGL